MLAGQNAEFKTVGQSIIWTEEFLKGFHLSLASFG